MLGRKALYQDRQVRSVPRLANGVDREELVQVLMDSNNSPPRRRKPSQGLKRIFRKGIRVVELFCFQQPLFGTRDYSDTCG